MLLQQLSEQSRPNIIAVMHFGCLIMSAYAASDCSSQAQCIIKTVTTQPMASKTQEAGELFCSHDYHLLSSGYRSDI